MHLKILIVDDSGFVRELLNRACAQLGHEIIGEAVDGEEAIQIASAVSPDLIFMDLALPKRNGIESASEIMSINPGIKIIACSSIDDENIIKKAIIEVGCACYLKKPFNLADVKEAISAAFQDEIGEAYG